MEQLRLFETPLKVNQKLESVFPVLAGILQNYGKAISYWKVYTVKHTTVILVDTTVETIVLLANKKQKISTKEIEFVKEKLVHSGELVEVGIDHTFESKLERAYDRNYKDILLFKKVDS